MLPIDLLEKNRTKLNSLLKDNSLLIFPPNIAPNASADASYQYFFDRNIFYFTGIKEEGCALIISKIHGKVTYHLFLKQNDPLTATWLGKTLTFQEAAAISHICINHIAHIDQFAQFLNTQINHLQITDIYLFFNPFAKESENHFANKLQKQYPFIGVKNCFSLISQLRLVKEEAEIAKIKECIALNKKGLQALFSKVKHYQYEYQFAAEFNYSLQLNNVTTAFPTIIAAGANATCLHHNNLNGKLIPGDLLLIDCGVCHDGYNSDISRTIPISGVYSPEQKKLYNIVLDCQEYAISLLKPGVIFGAVNNQVKQYAAEQLLKAGMISDIKDIDKYFLHSIGHSLGLDTHDICGPRSELVLQAGMVVTIEPGLYINNIGIRIEDDILITADGAVNLSADIIKTIDEIEKELGK